MKLSIVIPCFNEKNTIQAILKKVLEAPVPDKITSREIIIVDDYSTDGTREILHSLKDPRIRVILHHKNQGKGGALRTGFSHTSGDIILIQDADLEYDPNEYPKLLAPIFEHNADIVYGSRFIGGQQHRVLYFWHSVINRTLTTISNMFSDLNLTDMETCYKAFRREILEQITIEENRFGFEPEFTAKIGNIAKEKNLVIYEIGISYYGRTFEEGKKIKATDGIRALWSIYKYNTSGFASFIKYGLNGLVVALSQFIFMITLVELFNLNNQLTLNLANIISIEAATIIAFYLHTRLTWRQSFKHPLLEIKTFFYFHLLNLITMLTRIGMFFMLERTGMNYRLNTLLGIVTFILLNYIMYDQVIFRKKIERTGKTYTRGSGLLESFLSQKRASVADKNIPQELRKGIILDIGCGRNPFFLTSIKFQKKIGIDKNINLSLQTKELTLLIADFEKEQKIPLADASIQTVTMLAVIEHLEPTAIPGILKEIHRVLAPDGIFILTTPAKWTDKLLKLLTFFGLLSKQEIAEHKDTYTHKKLNELLLAAGFDKKNIQLKYFEGGMNILGKITK
jgi:glycosyltransferase involved in cell wall biosynthesis